jgi:hypothetical protein
MKKSILTLSVLLFAFLLGCQQKTGHKHQAVPDETELPATGKFGEEIISEGSLPAQEIVNLLNDADSVEAKLSGTIISSCKHSGCWMDIAMEDQEVIHVTFRNDEFTIPLDAAGKSAVFQGVAYREKIPVEVLKNYAREDGKSKEEIEAISEPAWEYKFVANGVVIEE